MSPLENATRFFHACESSEGWEACQQYVEAGASFEAQAGPLTEIHSVRDYTEWMAGVPAWMPDGRYDLHSSAWDEENRVAMFFATFHGHHTGEGGPVPPTNQKMSSDYVYALYMNEDGRVAKMRKVWNAAWAMRQLGWV